MSDPDLMRFAESLMRLVRDEAIETCDHLAAGRMRGPGGERWRRLIEGEDAREAVAELVPEIVDEVLFKLLHALDNNDIPLAWRRNDGSWAALEDLGMGEMAGWLGGEGGWIATFSEQRFHDYLDGLHLKWPDPREDEV